MNGVFEATGGARIGWTNATWPMAKLTANSSSVRLNVRWLGDYTFPSESVVAITRYTMIPIVAWGIQIHHSIGDYPEKIIFWSLGSPDRLLTGIWDAGFRYRASASTVPPRVGMAFRWQTVLIAILVWNGLLSLDMVVSHQSVPAFGPFSTVAVGLVLVSTAAILHVPTLQRFVLKPGRSLSEIRPFLNVLLVVCAFILVMKIFIGVSK